MLSKFMISRNYKKKKHDVVIRLNNFASEEEKLKLSSSELLQDCRQKTKN